MKLDIRKAMQWLFMGAWLLVVQTPVFATDAGSSAESSGFHLSLSDHNPKAGDAGERSILFSISDCKTNFSNGGESISNSVQFFELKGHEKIVTWDVTDNVSKVEMVVGKLIAGHDSTTNELLNAGYVLVGNSLGGASFFRGAGASLSSEVRRELVERYNISPRGLNPFRNTRFPESVAVGETWPIAKPTTNALTHTILGHSYIDAVEATGQFVGVTNVAGFSCFHVRQRVVSTNTPSFLPRILGEAGLPLKMDVKLSITADLIAPTNAVTRLLSQRYVIEMSDMTELKAGEHPQRFSQSVRIIRMRDDFRPAPEN